MNQGTVLFLMASLRGGAALSLAKYVKAVSKSSFKIVVYCMCMKDEAIRSSSFDGLSISYYSSYKLARPLEVFNVFKFFLDICKRESISLIHVNWVGNYPLAKALGKTLGIPVVYSYVDSTILHPYCLEGLNNGQVFITYCKDFSSRLIRAGISSRSIITTPRRFDFSNKTSANLGSTPRANDTLRIASIGRLDSEKLSSFRSALVLIESLLKSGYVLRFDVYGDGTCLEQAKYMVSNLQESHNFEAIFHGYVKNAAELLTQHDLILSRGRGTIEAAVQGVRSIVVSDTGEWYLVRMANWKLLAEANFTGRNLNAGDPISILNSYLQNDRRNSQDLINLRSAIIEAFDYRPIKPLLLNIYTSQLNQLFCKSPISSLLELQILSFRFFFLRIQARLLSIPVFRILYR
jgi:hypothetical protein